MINLQETAVEGLALYNQGQYAEARRKFNDVIEQNYHYLWAHAHLAETYAAIAKTHRDNTRYSQTVSKALKHFLVAVGLDVPRADPDDPILDLGKLTGLTSKPPKSDNSEARMNLAWAWAHFGELLRTIANQSWRIERNLLKDTDEAALPSALDQIIKNGDDSVTVKDIYHAAVKCFDKAIALRADYAWAMAHQGATWCNARQEDKYNEALSLLDEALRFKDGYYPWCTAYKAAIYLLMDKMTLSFFNLYEAHLQSPKLVDNAVRPFSQYNTEASYAVLYGMALHDYASVRELDVEISTRYYYQKYYQLVLEKLELTARRQKAGPIATVTDDVIFSTKHTDLLNELAADSIESYHQDYLQAALAALKQIDFEHPSQCPNGAEPTLALLKKAIGAASEPFKDQIRRFAVSDVVWFPFHKNTEFSKIVGLD